MNILYKRHLLSLQAKDSELISKYKFELKSLNTHWQIKLNFFLPPRHFYEILTRGKLEPIQTYLTRVKTDLDLQIDFERLSCRKTSCLNNVFS